MTAWRTGIAIGRKILGGGLAVVALLLFVNTVNPESTGDRRSAVMRVFNQAGWWWTASDPVSRAADAARSGEWKSALDVLTKALAEDPHNPELLYQTAGAYAGADRPLLAAIHFRAYLEAIEHGIEPFDWERERFATAWRGAMLAAEMARQQAFAVRIAIVDLAAAIPPRMLAREALHRYEALSDPPSEARGGHSAFSAERFASLQMGMLCTATHDACAAAFGGVAYESWIGMVRSGRVQVRHPKTVDGRACCGLSIEDAVLRDIDGAIGAIAALPPQEQPRAMYRVFSKLVFVHNLLLQNNNHIRLERRMLPDLDEPGRVWSTRVDFQDH